MTTELVLLSSIFALILLGVFAGRGTGPNYAFLTGAPHLGARIEQHLGTGRGFASTPGNGNARNEYLKPDAAAPTSEW